MYKRASRTLQHAHRVAAPLPTGGYIGTAAPVEHDFIPSADNMSLQECEAERRQLTTELVKAENQLIASKAAGDERAITGLGHRIQAYVQRLSLINRRLKKLANTDDSRAFNDAVKEIVDAETFERIIARKREIIANAQAIEARSAATGTGAVEDESAVPEGCAQPTSERP